LITEQPVGDEHGVGAAARLEHTRDERVVVL
jgi:hypothetical protein